MQSNLGDGKTCKILLVEDDLVDIALVRRQLAQVHRPRFHVETAQLLEEALEKITSESFDAIVLDLNLPDCNSMDSVDQLKASYSSGPIIVLTGQDEECHGIDAIRHGAEDYLVKDGLSASLLSRAISHSIERHRLTYWIKATGDSKDEYLADVCDELKGSLSELLVATSVLVENDDVIDAKELEQIEIIMSCGKRMSDLIAEARPKTPLSKNVTA